MFFKSKKQKEIELAQVGVVAFRKLGIDLTVEEYLRMAKEPVIDHPLVEHEFTREDIEDMACFELLPFDFLNVPVINEYGNDLKRYLFEGENKSQILKDIYSINNLICEAEKRWGFPSVRFSDINFDATNYPRSFIDFTFFKCHPNTATGRVAKYIMTVFVETQLNTQEESVWENRLFSKFKYLTSGKIGAGRISYWHERKLHTFKFKLDKDGYTIFNYEIDQQRYVKQAEV